MASWVLECRNCKTKFIHSAVDDFRLANFYMPVKPDFAVNGREYECPNCGYKAIYKNEDIKYKS